MQSNTWLQVFIRTLPALTVMGLGFYAAMDKSTRERWGDLLYQLGSIRPDQREDAKIGKGVKWPFFVVALAMLLWPINYYRIATRRFEIKSDIYAKPAVPTTIYDKNQAAPTANSAANAVGNSTTNSSAAGTSPSSVTNTPTSPQRTNVYGQPR